jgi:c(7)-type cytochrome triheme protein
MKSRLLILAVAFGLVVPFVSGAKETKDVKFTFRNADPVIFSHDVHLLKYNNNCKVCHNAIFNLRERRHYTMAEMEKTKSCGACHSGIKAFSVADEKSCTRCHAGKPRNVTYKIKGAAEALFSHEVHVAKTGGKCRSCHNATVITGRDKNVSMAQMEKGKTCGACHDGKKAFTVAGNCGRCHKGMKPREIPFKVKGATDVLFSHKFHTDAFGCNDCHTKTFPFKAGAQHFTMADMETGKSCGACHNGKAAFATTGDCAKCHKGFTPPEVTIKLTTVDDATFSHKFHIEVYACKECHTKNFPFRSTAQNITMVQMDQGKSCGACHNGKDAFSTTGDCAKCHKGYRPPPIYFKNDGGQVKFNHAYHLTKRYACADCHTKLFPFRKGVKHVNMTGMEKGESCGACHNGKDAFTVKENCDRCHKM